MKKVLSIGINLSLISFGLIEAQAVKFTITNCKNFQLNGRFIGSVGATIESSSENSPNHSFENLSNDLSDYLCLNNLDFQNQDLRNVNLKLVKLKGAKLQNARLSDTIVLPDYQEENRTPLFDLLVDGNDEEKIIMELLLSGGVNFFRGVDHNRLILINLLNLNVENADLSNTDLSNLDLTQMNFSGADLTGANLSGANLTGANLSGAKLIGANLSGVDLTQVNLTGADLTQAKLTGTKKS